MSHITEKLLGFDYYKQNSRQGYITGKYKSIKNSYTAYCTGDSWCRKTHQTNKCF